MSFCLGLIGGIGMGKFIVVGIFCELGYLVWDVDVVVYWLYVVGGVVVQLVGVVFFGMVKGYVVDWVVLKVVLVSDFNGFVWFEVIVYLLVVCDCVDFIVMYLFVFIVVLDIFLLFEGGLQVQLDGVVVVFVLFDVQCQCVMVWFGMIEQIFQMILLCQMFDVQKCVLVDWVILFLMLQDVCVVIVDICDQFM